MKFALNLKPYFIAICSFELTIGITKEFYFVLDFETYLQAFFISFGTFFVYNLPSQIEFKKQNLFFILQFILLLILAFFIIKSYFALTILFFIFLISFFYVSSFAFLKIKIRKIPYLKSFLISISWTYACVIFPLLNNFENIHLNIILSFFCFFLALTIPFDIRDYEHDKGKIKTIVGKIGINNSKILAFILLLFAFIFSTFSYLNEIQNLLILGSYLYLFILILFTKKNFSSLKYEFLLDGSIILLGISYLF